MFPFATSEPEYAPYPKSNKSAKAFYYGSGKAGKSNKSSKNGYYKQTSDVSGYQLSGAESSYLKTVNAASYRSTVVGAAASITCVLLVIVW